MDEVVSLLNIPQPDYIKIDVDGIEHLILKGGQIVLKNIKGLLIEINDNYKEQAEKSKKLLLNSNLTFEGKKHNEIFFKNSNFSQVYNQNWSRKNNL